MVHFSEIVSLIPVPEDHSSHPLPATHDRRVILPGLMIAATFPGLPPREKEPG